MPRQLTNVGSKIVNLTKGRLISQQIFLVLISVTDWVEPSSLLRLEGLS